MYPRSLIPALPTFYKYVLFENSSIHGKEIHFVLGWRFKYILYIFILQRLFKKISYHDHSFTQIKKKCMGFLFVVSHSLAKSFYF